MSLGVWSCQTGKDGTPCKHQYVLWMANVAHWSTLPLSLWGRVDILKMNALPRLAHVISSIPLQFPQYWFRDIQSIFSIFLWKNKKPRISYKKMSMLKSKGGLSVPDMYLYYLAYNARFPIVWGYSTKTCKPNWDWLEEQIIKDHNKHISLPSLWYCPKDMAGIDNPIIRCSIGIVKLVHRRLGIVGSSLPSCPLWSNPLISAGGLPLNISAMKNGGLHTLGQIVKNNTMIPFSEMLSKFNMNNSSFLSYLQLKAVITKISSKGASVCSQEHLDKTLKKLVGGKGLVSGIYKLLLLSSSNTNIRAQSRWEED